jgi:anti-sigma B factor antagonist
VTDDAVDQLVVDCSRSGGELRVVVSGELDAATEPQLVAAAAAAIDDTGIEMVVLDASALSFIDSAGLRGLMRCSDHAAQRCLPMRLIPGHGVVARLLDVAGVAEWFSYD